MRYSALPIINNKNGTPYVSTFDISIPIDNFEYKIITYKNQRLDVLADQFYGDGSLYWIIALFNKISNPLNFDINYLAIPLDINAILNYIEVNSK
jgi:hypothetical protein